MAVFASEELNLGTSLEDLGVFDPLLDEDSNYFINIKRLKSTKVSEFSDSYNKINLFFKNIGILLKASKNKQDKNYRTALRRFDFPEVQGINLGFSKGKRGAGFGKKLKEKIINDASEIIKSGSEQPEIFHLVGLFEENVGPDRLSDMVARLIYDEIVLYTKNVNELLGINQDNYPNIEFVNGLAINSYKKCEILLLPVDILHELPIARDWEDIDRVCRENETIREEINGLVGKEWKKLSVGKKKEYIREYIFKKPDILQRVIANYEATVVAPYDVNKNMEYLIEKVIHNIRKTDETVSNFNKSSFEAAREILLHYKQWVENQKGYSVLQGVESKNEEKIVQRTLHGCAGYYCNINGLDISPESNTGRGPVDFKISRGMDKTVIEIKLTSNSQVVHGFEVQIEEYAKSEQTENKIFLLVDNGKESHRVLKVKESYEKRKAEGQNPADIIIIDAKPKSSASNYKPDED
ncbi:hypothetical protein [Paenibacillus etheri]|uniref:Uncharacterized protein n=1 Tax=Paenibacillus etheri TaxID=1306852 RepID=A0A0W1B1M7_9BACL|nr:hypothetical protein [Paenibacillus etheri]KTD87463.1 hypothetical protein UQ64_11660 [Paenibacillus etheri]